MADRLPERLSHEDAAFLTFDRDEFPYNVGSVGIYQGVIPFDAYVWHVAERLDLAPRYRQRLLWAPLNVAHPAWHDDPEFNIERHISEVVLPPPGGDAQLGRLAAEFFAAPLDRREPLWQIRLVRGLSGDRTAHLAKIHHCLVDGIGGVQLLGALLDLEPSPARRASGSPWSPPAAIPGPIERFVDGAFDQIQQQVSNAEDLALALVDPRSAVRAARSIAGSLQASLPHMFRLGRTPWATRLTSPRHLAWQRLPFERVQRVRHALRGTVNDLVLTVLSGALGRYLALRGERSAEQVRVLIPVNVRQKDQERDLGNRVSFMLAGLPVSMTDPVATFETIHEEIASLKEIDQAGNLDRLMGLLGRTPPALQHLLGARLRMPNFVSDLVCTNVPGPRAPLYCMGHRMTEHYPWVPIGWRMGLGVAVMSYDEHLYFSLTADRSVLDDLDRLGGFVGDAFEELEEAVVGTGETMRAAVAEEVELAGG